MKLELKFLWVPAVYVAALLLPVACVPSPFALAASPPRPGTLDRSFNGTGIAIRDFGVEPGYGGGRQVVVQTDGRFLVRTEFGAIGRFFRDGRLDTSFGEDGYLTGLGEKGSMAIDQAGRIIHAGPHSVSLFHYEVRVSRFLPDGSPDRSFGEGGSVSLSNPEQLSSIAAVFVQPDGRVLAVGPTSDYSRPPLRPRPGEMAAVRLLPDGSIDHSYGSGGYAVVQIPRPTSALEARAAFDGERLTLAVPGSASLLLIRIDAHGALDPSLGGSGMLEGNLAQGTPTGMAIQSDGGIVVSSAVMDAHVISRLRGDGSLDLSFGDGGRVVLPVSRETEMNAIALQPDGRIVLAGALPKPHTTGSRAFLMVRLEPDGTLDPTVGSGGGFISTDLGVPSGSQVGARALAVQPDGGILLVGEAPPRDGPSNRPVIGIASFTPEAGLDPSFGNGGGRLARPLAPSQDFILDLLVDAKDGILITGRAAGEILLARYRPDGKPDRSFRAGRVTTNLTDYFFAEEGTSLARYPGERMLVGTGSGAGAALIRLGLGGGPDPTFGRHGVVRAHRFDRIVDLAVTRTGAILAAGLSSDCAAVFARFRADGSIDRTFGGGDGMVHLGRALACSNANVNLALRPNGRIVVGGSVGLPFLHEYTPDGYRDPNFGKGARRLPAIPKRVRAIALDRRGRILIGGVIDHALGVVRLSARGLLDRSFDEDGRVIRGVRGRAAVTDLRIDAAGRIVAVGGARACPSGPCEDVSPMVARFTGDGRPDRRFAENGVWAGLPGGMSSLKAVALSRGAIIAGGWTKGPGGDRDLLLLGLHR